MSRSYIYKLAKRGEIDLVKMGGATMIRTESMHAYINSLPPMKPGQS
ncbi:MerR family transcriptional regulator [Acetobacter tropicalis]|nr:helix-turn-helix domain-containing protein [Acetobacter tropicalis]